jgi:predicted TIM-barrel fold metal-dependent hydrolase
VMGTVNVEANPTDPMAEARWLESLAGNPSNRGHPSGIVAYADLSAEDAPRVLEGLAGHSKVCGVRQILNIHCDPRYNYASRDYLSDARWRENLSRIGRWRWSFDLQVYPAQSAAAATVIKANPEIYFIVNHAGMWVDRKSVEGWRQWRTSLRTLALYENTAIKLSGFAMFDHRWTVESFRPLVLEAIECFGIDRCMFASNFPIDGLHASYPALWQAYCQIVSGATQPEREKLFMHNSIRYYRLRIDKKDASCPRDHESRT